MTLPPLVVPTIERNPRSPHDPILAGLAPGVYGFPVPFPGYVGRLVIVATPNGPRMSSYAVLDAADVDTSTDVAFEHFRTLREEMVRRGGGRRRGLGIVRDDAQQSA